ncbi:hypothetical protein GCM10010302_24310 [Streptomyces polychromogenes]|uniref:DUF6777 domain-containing protein n=1 Tax=Streptomyces polychromogenes TaxID=67342 RepID=A0ABP3F163_9ACTN
MNDVNDVPAPTPRQAPRRHVPAGAAVLALLGLIAAGCGAQEPEQTKGATAESQELTLQPVGAAGPDPFTASTATAESAPVQPPVPNKSGQGIRTVGAATPGLYGGTNRLGSCDVERQAAHLTADDAKARAFAQAAGVEQEKIPEFLRGLTPVVLRADTRITNHGFRDGRADGYQAVLQAGTAVLVDDHGMPRVRCGCGNPLAAPRSAKGSPVLKGDQWNGYRPNQVIVIEPTIQPIKRLVIVNVADNTWIERKAGDDGAQDKAPKSPPPYDPADGIPNAPATPPDDPAEPCATAAPHGPSRTVPPATPSAPPSGPPSDQPPAAVPPDLPETAPPLDVPPAAGGQQLPETAPPLDVPGQAAPMGARAETAPLDAPPAAGPPGAPAAGPAAPPDERFPVPGAPVDERFPVPGAPVDEQLPVPGAPVDERFPVPGAPVDEQLPVPAEPGRPGDKGHPGPPSATGPAPTPCPSDTGTGTGTGSATPGRPTAPQEPPASSPGDLPGGATTPGLPPSATPADPFPEAPLAPVPAEPGLTPDPEDVPTTGPAAPSDPFASPDQRHGTDQGADQPAYLESA